ncbi:hypothetical protein IHX65_004870 [Salmonella enterica]|nr:hypothetical protein [Salmonella enterica]
MSIEFTGFVKQINQTYTMFRIMQPKGSFMRDCQTKTYLTYDKEDRNKFILLIQTPDFEEILFTGVRSELFEYLKRGRFITDLISCAIRHSGNMPE